MTEYSSANRALPTQTPLAQGQYQQKVTAQEVGDEAAVTPRKLAGSVARVEYRDQAGNVLQPDLVASLRAEGKVKFETRFESQAHLENAQEIPIVDGQLVLPDTATP